MTEMFHWTSPDGVEITLPRLDQIKAGVLRRNRTKDPVDMLFSILEDVGDDKTLAKVDDLSMPALNSLMEKWQAEVSLGESSGSST